MAALDGPECEQDILLELDYSDALASPNNVKPLWPGFTPSDKVRSAHFVKNHVSRELALLLSLESRHCAQDHDEKVPIGSASVAGKRRDEGVEIDRLGAILIEALRNCLVVLSHVLIPQRLASG
ncbi:MAG: hypothetical protein WCS01_11190 [bacterium]